MEKQFFSFAREGNVKELKKLVRGKVDYNSLL